MKTATLVNTSADHARLATLIFAAVTKNTTMQLNELRKIIFNHTPWIKDIEFHLVLNHLVDNEYLYKTIPMPSLSAIISSSREPREDCFFASSSVNLHVAFNGEGTWELYPHTWADHYPDLEQVCTMHRILRDANMADIGARIIWSALKRLEGPPNGTLRLDERKLITSVTMSWADQRTEIYDYYTVKAFLSHAAFLDFVKKSVESENGYMIHRYELLPHVEMPFTHEILEKLKAGQ